MRTRRSAGYRCGILAGKILLLLSVIHNFASTLLFASATCSLGQFENNNNDCVNCPKGYFQNTTEWVTIEISPFKYIRTYFPRFYLPIHCCNANATFILYLLWTFMHSTHGIQCCVMLLLPGGHLQPWCSEYYYTSMRSLPWRKIRRWTPFHCRCVSYWCNRCRLWQQYL